MLLFTFLCTFVVLPIVGLAIDGSIQYWMRSRLSSAVDSCALSTARALNVGQSLDEQMANATALGQQYFNANFPAGMMGTSVVGGTPTITITKDARNTLIVNVKATASVPLYFMRVLGFNTSLVAASGQAQRRALNLILVLDRSGSMGPGGANVCGTMTAAAQNFVNNWVEGRDQVGLITFQTSANVDVAPSYYFKSNISAALSSLQCAGATNAAQGIYLAYQQIQQVNEPSAMNVIVFFTDGQPNAFQATYGIRTTNEPRYNWSNETAGSTMVSIAPQPCNSTDTLYGVVTTLFGGGSAFYVGGIYDSTPIAISSTAGASLAPINAPGCYFYNYST